MPNPEWILSKHLLHLLAAIGVWMCSSAVFGASDWSLPALMIPSQGDKGNTVTYALSLQTLLFMTFLGFLPAMVLMMTAFTRIIIVLSILRQALGLPQTPTNQILVGISIFLTFFIMEPVWNHVYTESLTPYFSEKITFAQAMEKGEKPVREFMVNQVRENDLLLFMKMSGKVIPENAAPESIPFSILMPAYLTSELKTAFQIGFLLFIPFLMIDLIVASVLMSMGMMMLSPMMISLPFKIMIFVLVDGWSLVFGTLAKSFGV